MDRIDVVTSSVTFTDPDAALAALQERMAHAEPPALAASAATLKTALQAFCLDLRYDWPEPDSVAAVYPRDSGPYSRSLVASALEAIAPFVANGSHIVCASAPDDVWRWRFTGSSVLVEHGSLAFIEGEPAARVVLAVCRPVAPRQLDRLAATIAGLVGDFDVHEFSIDAELRGARPHRRRVTGTTLQPADA